MATFDYLGYLESEVTWPGGSPSGGDTITFTAPTTTTISITDNDSSLQDGTDDRDDEDSNQTAVVTDGNGNPIDSGQIQPRERIVLSDGTNSYVMHRVFIASSNSYYYIFEDPAPSLNTTYTVTSVSTPNSTPYSSFSQTGITCFTAGTELLTPSGPRRVESLKVGDLVQTLDHGPQPILWHGKHHVSHAEMLRHPGLRPFRVAAHAFGPNVPVRPLIFSRQHRILIAGRPLDRILGASTALAHIHTLATPRRIEQIVPPFGVTYHHLLFARHHLLLSDGLISESLLWTDATKAICALLAASEGASEITAQINDMQPARPLLNNRDARRLMRKGRLRAPACRWVPDDLQAQA